MQNSTKHSPWVTMVLAILLAAGAYVFYKHAYNPQPKGLKEALTMINKLSDKELARAGKKLGIKPSAGRSTLESALKKEYSAAYSRCYAIAFTKTRRLGYAEPNACLRYVDDTLLKPKKITTSKDYFKELNRLKKLKDEDIWWPIGFYDRMSDPGFVVC